MKYRKKPIAIEAWQWNGEQSGQMEGVCQCDMNRVPHLHTAHVTDFNPAGQLVFLTKGDWIIPEQSGGHYYPCKPDIFAATYEDANAFAQRRPSKFSPGDPVEVRKQNDEIDEIVIRRGDVHIEQMSCDGWFMGIDAEDGSYWQFWFGSKNRKSHVQFRHTETVSEQESSSTPGQAIERTPTHVSWLDADYNKARDCMIGLLRGHGWTISENSVGVKEFDNAFQHAVGILALTASTDSISVNLPFERLPQHAGDPGFGPVPNIIPLGSSDPNHPSNIAAVTSAVSHDVEKTEGGAS